MKKKIIACNSKMLNQISDRELAPEQLAGMKEHLENCSNCRKQVQNHEAISSLFKKSLARETSEADVSRIEENVIARIRKDGQPWWSKARHFVLSKRFYVPATAVAAALLLIFVFAGPNGQVSGPSAVISRVGGDIESVMILETQKSHTTVVWFNEAASSKGEEDGFNKEQSNVRTLYGKTYSFS